MLGRSKPDATLSGVAIKEGPEREDINIYVALSTGNNCSCASEVHDLTINRTRTLETSRSAMLRLFTGRTEREPNTWIYYSPTHTPYPQPPPSSYSFCLSCAVVCWLRIRIMEIWEAPTLRLKALNKRFEPQGRRFTDGTKANSADCDNCQREA